MLYSEGFESTKILANKVTQLYQLCSELLSQQDHYDFGMRFVFIFFVEVIVIILNKIIRLQWMNGTTLTSDWESTVPQVTFKFNSSLATVENWRLRGCTLKVKHRK